MIKLRDILNEKSKNQLSEMLNSKSKAGVYNKEKKQTTYYWQEKALETIEKLDNGEKKKGSIFKCFKIDTERSIRAFVACEELGKMHANYFLKMFHVIGKKKYE